MSRTGSKSVCYSPASCSCVIGRKTERGAGTINTSPDYEWQNSISQSARSDETPLPILGLWQLRLICFLWSMKRLRDLIENFGEIQGRHVYKITQGTVSYGCTKQSIYCINDEISSAMQGQEPSTVFLIKLATTLTVVTLSVLHREKTKHFNFFIRKTVGKTAKWL